MHVFFFFFGCKGMGILCQKYYKDLKKTIKG